MNSILIDQDSDVIFTASKEFTFNDLHHETLNINKHLSSEFDQSKRNFLLASLAVSTLTMLPSQKAQAWWPVAIIAGIVARSIIQGIARVVGRSVATRVIGKASIGVGYSTLSTRVQASVVEEVISDLAEHGMNEASKKVVHQLALDQPQALWAQDEKLNPLSIIAVNHTDKAIETKIKLGLVDEGQHKARVNKGAVILVEPFSKVKFDIKIFKDLPNSGRKRTVLNLDSVPKGLDVGSSGTSGKITVMPTEDIYI